MDQKVALVAGAGGIIGRGIVEHLSGRDDREIVDGRRGAVLGRPREGARAAALPV
jgi:NAD(P)-dependent dehydrogenase (short-subunit alcohol dehydrogenase family)